MIIADGWLQQAIREPSPNADSRPTDQQISLLVIHNISLPPGCYGGGHINDFFANRLKIDEDPYFSTIKDLNVSAHLLIDREGQITQFVSLADRAWHAGVSCFNRQERCNDYAIGIELEGTDIESYTNAQYDALIQVTLAIMVAYPLITPERIVGHSDIAPGRKTDPGISFDWYDYLSTLLSKLQGAVS